MVTTIELQWRGHPGVGVLLYITQGVHAEELISSHTSQSRSNFWVQPAQKVPELAETGLFAHPQTKKGQGGLATELSRSRAESPS